MEALQSKEEEKEGREESDSEEDEYYLQILTTAKPYPKHERNDYKSLVDLLISSDKEQSEENEPIPPPISKPT